MNTDLGIVFQLNVDDQNYADSLSCYEGKCLCIEPVNAKNGEFKVHFREFVKEGETFVSGPEALRRAKEEGIVCGLCHLKSMLREQNKIPVEEQGHILISTEVFLDPLNFQRIWILHWDFRGWSLSDSWLASPLGAHCRLVDCRKL